MKKDAMVTKIASVLSKSAVRLLPSFMLAADLSSELYDLKLNPGINIPITPFIMPKKLTIVVTAYLYSG
jgi:hypothetical protein